jgi:phage/plasmid-associated DNA primase
MDDEVIDTNELEDASTNFDDGYIEMKTEWERNHFYFKPTGTVVEQNDDGSMTHYKLEHATEAFNMWRLKPATNGEEPEPFLKKWRMDSERRIVERLVMKLHEDCAVNEATTFRGFHYKRLNTEMTQEQRNKHIACFTSLIKNMVGDDYEVYTALLKNFARCIQRPFERPDLCIILSSKQHGVGKETLINIISKVIGKNTAHYISDESFWDKHDTKKEGAILQHLEEAGATNKKMSDQLKARITAEVCSVRPCGINPYDVENTSLYVMTTNKPLPIKLEESDRRFFIICCQGRTFATREEKMAYWTEVYEEIKMDSFIQAVGEYLESIDLTGFNPRMFPETEYKKSMMETCKTAEALFLEQWINIDDGGDEVSSLYQQYKSYCMDKGLPYKMSSNSFAQAIVRENEYYTKGHHHTTRRAVYKSKKTDETVAQ